jgi:hypothetical protein
MNIKNEQITLDKSQYVEICPLSYNFPKSFLEIGQDVLFQITEPEMTTFVPQVSCLRMASITDV